MNINLILPTYPWNARHVTSLIFKIHAFRYSRTRSFVGCLCPSANQRRTSPYVLNIHDTPILHHSKNRKSRQKKKEGTRKRIAPLKLDRKEISFDYIFRGFHHWVSFVNEVRSLFGNTRPGWVCKWFLTFNLCSGKDCVNLQIALR